MMTLMKSGLLGALVFVLLSSSQVSGLTSVLEISYWHKMSHRTWSQAQEHCRSHHVDLAIFHNYAEVNRVYRGDFYGWIGLYKDESPSGEEEWTWILRNSSRYINWAPGEPKPEDRCAVIKYSTHMMYGANCGEYFFFFCQHKWYSQSSGYQSSYSSYRSSLVSLSMTWAEARAYCWNINSDLTSSVDYLRSFAFPVWIGLHREEETWKWSLGSSDFWRSNYYRFDHDCAAISSTNTYLESRSCSERFPFVCVSDNLVLVRERKTWEEALEHCRAMSSPDNPAARYDLVSVQSGNDHDYMTARLENADTQEVWVGLRFLAGTWLWMTGAVLSYPDLPQCPTEWHHCGVLTTSNWTSVETRDCAERRNFLCHRK